MNAKIRKELKRLEEHHTSKDDLNMLQKGQFAKPDCPTKRKNIADHIFGQSKRRAIRIGKKYQATICSDEDNTDASVLISTKEIEYSLSMGEEEKLITRHAQKPQI